MPRGIFVALVGPSGAGKDTLLQGAANALKHRPDICFTRRVITRPRDGVTEDHDTLTEAAFDAQEAGGGFCLSWRAHGLAYGLPVSVLQQIENGSLVIANISRAVLGQAASVFPRMAIISIDADPTILARRIAARGRETEAQAAHRIARRVPLDAPPGAPIHKIDNSGSLEAATTALVLALQSVSDDL